VKNVGENRQLEGWVFVDTSNPLVNWEVGIGRMISACDVAAPGIVSHWLYGLIRSAALSGDFSRYFRELELEAIRQRDFPNCVSRLTGIYLFEAKSDCIRARKEWGISQLKTEITDIGFSATQYSRHDSNWLLDQRQSIAKFGHKYWSGEPMNGTPLWELICSGIGRVWEREVQLTCYKKAYYRDPRASAFLWGSTVLFIDGKERAGMSKPFLRFDGHNLIGELILRDIELKEFKLNKANPLLEEVQLPIHVEAYNNFAAPDFTEMFFSVPVITHTDDST
jgi:hypothetical protein